MEDHIWNSIRQKSGIWFLDLRKPDNSPMALHGWMSPDGMEELLAADVDSRNKELKRDAV